MKQLAGEWNFLQLRSNQLLEKEEYLFGVKINYFPNEPEP
jgi:hypothetical protein